jgi:3-hydroxymyristoyl/3-hydroxydecanoyl-(acyl carrier protein) dehydratase
MSETATATRTIAIAPDHPAFDGHFPGQPVLPGVALLAEVLEAALDEPTLAACVGTAPRLQVVKFLAPVRPGTELVIAFRLGARSLDWQVGDGARDVASGQIARADLGAAAAP